MSSRVFKQSVMVAAIAAYSFPMVVSAQGMALEEVIVTAEKRAQSLQDVPISIVALNAEALAAQGIDELDDLATSIPNLYVNNFNNDPVAVRLFIRGIGQNDLQLTQDPSVALYLDGVYIGTTFGAGFEGVDLERIEVLRGPQGTLYGRNATGGAVNLITRRASPDQFEFHQTLTAGNLDLFKSRTFINVPIGDSFAAKVGYIMTDRDGYVENTGVGEDFGTEDRESAVVDLHWDATDTLVFDYRYETAEIADSGRMEQSIIAGQEQELPPGVPNLSFLTTPGTVSEDRQDKVNSLWQNGPTDLQIDAHTLHADWEIGDVFTLRSITAQRDMDSFVHAIVLPDWQMNLIPGGGSVSTMINDVEFEQLSQEIQFLGSWDSVELVTGFYYYEDEGTHDSSASSTLGLPGPEYDITFTDNTSMAAFAQATWSPAALDQRWHFTLGGRYSQDERKAFRRNTRSADFAASAPEGAYYDEDFSNFNPSFTVAWDISDDANLYGKVVSGYKSGGTSTRSANADLFRGGFEEEDVLSYELGLKADFLDSRLRFNGALFYMDIDGSQTSIQTGTTAGERDFLPVDGNVIQGLEVELTAALTQNLVGSLNYGYLDTEVGEDFVDSPVGTFYLADRYSYAPENSVSASLDYRRDLDNGSLHGRIAYSYQDETISSVNLLDLTDQDDRSLWDASFSWSGISLGDVAGEASVMVWGKNLTDEEYIIVSAASWGFVGSNYTGTFGDPRTYGVTLTWDY
ncbi:TonB-dependent receptor [Halioglobus maricola]|uniref:TonB-dependent receptor n=1 Tax=Halioglobus maricola TaxID=2601894 RepID=A0A5P9NJQ9_9GAMM|nr:TonB-dependent receptor [Halioglobus maricola]QFU75208.1 TonB-dependent receptor [Halioglobus maricola]